MNPARKHRKKPVDRPGDPAMTVRLARTAAVCGWAVLALAAPGIAYIIGGLALLWLLVRHLAQQVDAGEADPDQDIYSPPGADCGCSLCSASLRAEFAEGFWRRAADQWRAEMTEGDES